MTEKEQKRLTDANKATIVVIALSLLPLLLMLALQNSEMGVVIAYCVMTVVYVLLFLFGGFYAGKNVKTMWYLPLLPTIVLMFFSWFSGGNPLANAFYWGRGSVVGVLVMLLTSWLRRKLNK